MIRRRGHRRGGAAAAAALARLRHPRDPVHPARRRAALASDELALALGSTARARRLALEPSRAQPARPVRAQPRAASARRAASAWCSAIAPPRSASLARRATGLEVARRGCAARARVAAARALARAAKRSHARAKEMKLVRPPWRWAASIGQTPPRPVGVGADDDLVARGCPRASPRACAAGRQSMAGGGPRSAAAAWHRLRASGPRSVRAWRRAVSCR